jgi:dTDP-glucose 4,6-dehydratase
MAVNWNHEKALVTGAGGFIGSHLAERLVHSGARVRALVHYNALGTTGWLEHSPLRNDMEIIAGDICDRDSISTAMKDTGIVFHLAALIAIPYSYQAPASYVRTNIKGTLNVLQAACELGVKRVIHTSTSEVYGTARFVPITEEHPLQAQSPYSASKIGADKLSEAFHLSFGLPVVTLRPFNTFGPRQSARAIIPTIITQCLARRTMCLGNLYPTRDLNFVGNTVDAYLLASEAADAVGKTINVGSGREIRIGDLAELIGKIAGIPIRIESDTSRVRSENSEVGRLMASNALAQKILGWQPKVTLEDGLGITISWFRDHLKMYRPGKYVV